MALPNFSVRRPVTIIMFFLGVVLFGFISWFRLPQELYPPITYPQLSVVTFYKDAAPEEMEILVTKLVEESVGTVSGVRRISSTSKEETSLVVAEFNWGTNMDFAALGVREKIDLIKESLPRGSEDPIVMKFNPFELALMVLNITADTTLPGDLQQIVKKVIKTEIEKGDGVASCNISGGVTPEIIVEVDQDKLMSKELALHEIVEALSKANLNYPAGTIEESFYEYLIRTIGEFEVVADIRNIVVAAEDRTKKTGFSEFGTEDLKEKQEKAIPHKRLVLLRDVAVVNDTFKEKTSISRYNGQENISVAVQKQADANTLKVANDVKKIISRLQKLIPKDVVIDVVYDQSAFVRSAISGVRDAAFQGGILAFLVLLFFLRSAKSAGIVALNIPISIMAVFSLMYFSGITINMISLGGLALGVGMLVDNGIVVIENIYRHRQEENRGQKESSVSGANEVSGAITGSTLTTIAVFLPMVFVIGIAGQLFKELAFTVIFSLLGSLAVALTLIPILSSHTRSRKNPPLPFRGEPALSEVEVGRGEGSLSPAGRLLQFLQDVMQKILVFFLGHKLVCLGIVVVVFVAACSLLPALDIEFLPKIDQGQFIIKVNLPPGARLKVTDQVCRSIESHLLDIEDVESITVNIGSTKEKKGTALLETMGPHQGQIIVNLKPLARLGKAGAEYRHSSTSEALQKLKSTLKSEELCNAELEYILQESVFKTAFQAGAPVVVEVKGHDFGKLRKITAEVEGFLGKIPGIYSIRNSLVKPAPEVKINVFKEKATTYNLSTSDIALTAQTAVKGYIATKFKKEGEEIDVRVRLEKQDRDNMAKVRRLQLRSPLGVYIPLAEVGYFSLGKGPTEIKRHSQQRAVLVTANIFKRSFKEIADRLSVLLEGLELPSGYSANLTGEREQIEESFTSLRMALILSIVLVFMIMASQFESLWQPLVIMFTIPLSIIGVILILLITNTPLSVMVILGIIILGGIVVNNGIVLIDYANILRKQGLSAYEAVILASQRRLRPIVMTALTTILALIPLALALNEGAQLQQPMAIAVIGGLAVSTFLSLVVIPTLYLGLEESLIFIRKNIFGVAAGVDSGPKPMPPTPPPAPPPPSPPPKPIPPKPVPPDVGDRPSGREPTPSLKPTPPKPIPPDVGDRPSGREPSPPKLVPPKETPSRESIPPDAWASLSKRQRELIVYIRDNKKISRKDYAEKFNISIPTAARDLKQLLDKGILTAEGPSSSGRHYVLNRSA